ncbi:MAG: tripartite tricarboxylate transporter substrate binding protein [Polaromonas sp.]|jgi:tripartite-type tricarboxylate transporter receptor subunit TctC|nr:tripartite tricarboxylate transporter substrate binding protein [Polaromonas sp.]
MKKIINETNCKAWTRVAVVALGLLASSWTLAQNSAEAYPNRPVKIMVGYGPGGTGDLTVRLVAQKLVEKTGQAFVVDNRPSAGGIVASQVAQQATPDGYTLNFIAAGNFAMTPSLFKSLPFDPVKDFEMVSLIGTFGFALAVDSKSTITDARDLIAQAKADPGKLFIGTISVGSAQFLAAEVFRSMAGIEATIVPYKTSADVVRALRAGDVQAIFETIAPVIPHVKAGTMRVLGVTEAQRFPGLPNVPTIAESGLPNYEIVGWNGIAAPARTPREVIARLNAEINAAVVQPDIRQKFLDLGVIARGNTPEQMTALLKKDIAWWRDVIEKARIAKQ